MIENYFGVPILMFDYEGETLNQIQNEINTVIPTIRNLDLSNPWDDTVKTTFKFGTTNNDLSTLKINTLRNEILKLANDMCPSYTLILKESWFNFSYKGNFQFDHAHGDATLSGVYYYQTNEQDGNIKFKNPNTYEFAGMGINPNNKWIFSQPKIGRIIIFPSYIEHRVDPNTTDSERISIAFNLCKV